MCGQYGCSGLDCAQQDCAQPDASGHQIKNTEIQNGSPVARPGALQNPKSSLDYSKNQSDETKGICKNLKNHSEKSKGQSINSVSLFKNATDKINEKVKTGDTRVNTRVTRTIADIIKECKPKRASGDGDNVMGIVLEAGDGPPDLTDSEDEHEEPHHAENVPEIDVDSESDAENVPEIDVDFKDDSEGPDSMKIEVDPGENITKEILETKEKRLKRQRSLGLPGTEYDIADYTGPCWCFRTGAISVVVEKFPEKICMAGDGQQKIFVTLDSGAVAHCANPRDLPGTIEVQTCDEARNFVNATGNSIDHWGSAKVRLQQANGNHITNTFQVMDVCRPFHSVSMIADQGYDTVFSKSGAVVIPAGLLDDLLATVKHVATYQRVGGLYVTEVTPKDPAKADPQPFAGPGRSR